VRQIAQRRNRQLSESEYIEIITEKSAALFSSSCHLGGLLADATEAQRRALLEFGLNAGIGFQIADDLLDITGDENTTGKTLGSDVDKNKLTLAVIHLLRTAKAGEKEAVKRELDNAGTDRNSLMEMLNSCGSLEYARAKAKEYAVRAAKALSSFEQSEAKNAMIETAQFMADRVI